MAYSSSSGLRKARPVLATAIARASAAPNNRSVGSVSASSNSGGSSFFMNNRDLRRYRDRILIVLLVAAIYTFYIVKSGMLALSFFQETPLVLLRQLLFRFYQLSLDGWVSYS